MKCFYLKCFDSFAVTFLSLIVINSKHFHWLKPPNHYIRFDTTVYTIEHQNVSNSRYMYIYNNKTQPWLIVNPGKWSFTILINTFEELCDPIFCRIWNSKILSVRIRVYVCDWKLVFTIAGTSCDGSSSHLSEWWFTIK